ncbi:MAG: amino acid-binding protein [Planctomycetota bacterium]
MEIVTQISIFMENQPGVLARICEALGAQKIQIQGFSIVESSEHGLIRAVVSDPVRAIHLLGEGGLLVTERDVLSLQVPNRAGAMAEIARLLGRHRINILYGYGSNVERTRIGQMFLSVSNPERALEVLSANLEY